MNATRKSLLIALMSTVLFAPVAHARQGADDGIGHVRQEDRQLDRREDRRADRQLDRRMNSTDDSVSGGHQHKKKQKRNRRGRGR